VAHLFTDEKTRAAQVAAMNDFATLLGEKEEPPSLRAARVLLDFVEKR